MAMKNKVYLACLPFALAVSVQAQSGSAPVNSPSLECSDYASKLESCSLYTCTFTHPMTGERLERKIIGLTGGNCATTESMPGKHKTQCEFPPDMRNAVATFFRETQAAEAAGKTIGGTFAAKGNGKPTSSTTVDGKPVVNPLQQAIEAGSCKIGG
jgi:hypothetical protein